MSSLLEWIPSLSTTSIFAAILFLSRNLIITRLTNAVKHEYDAKLEKLKADISKKNRELESLRSVGYTGLQQRQTLLYEKQVKGIETLWSATCSLYTGRPVSEMMLRVKSDVVSETISKDSSLQEFFKYISKHVDLEKLGNINANSARPFVSKLAWAYFSAYQSIIFQYVLQAKLFEKGLGDELLEKEKITNLVKIALPHQNKFIEEYGVSAFGHLLEELQEKLLQEFDAMLNGETIDKDGLQKAAKIQKIAEDLSSKNKDLTKVST